MTTPAPTNTEASSEVIEKIEKLLNLAARAGTEGEAKAAFAAAAKLMTKYGIEQHQLGGKKDEKPLIEEVKIDKTWRTERPAHVYVRQVIRHCFHVSVIRVRGFASVSYYMLGTREDCLFASYAFDVLSETFLRLQNEYLKEFNQPRIPRIYNGFFEGLATGFRSAWDEAQRAQIKEQKAESYAIVLIDKDKALEDYLAAAKGIKFKKNKRTSDEFARYHGYQKGRTIKIARGLEAGDNSAQQLR